MKKRRVVALALATTMAFSSFSSAAYADETVSPASLDDATVEEAEASETPVEEAEDDATSDAALTLSEGEATMRGGLLTNVAEDGEWKATVTGDAGGAEKIDGSAIYEANPDYKGTPYYSVVEGKNGKVDMRMGVFDNDGNVLEAAGKISSSSDGLVMYYKEAQASDSFELSATAKINRIDNKNNQVSFGIGVRNEVQPMTYGKKPVNMLAVGALNMKNVGGKNGMLKAFSRNNRVLITADPENENSVASFLSEATSAPKVGDEINLKLRKNGNTYVLSYGNLEPVVVHDFIEMSDTIYPSLFVVRSADVTFSNIEYKTLENKYQSIEIKSLPDRTTFVLGTDFDSTGLVVEGTLADGTKEIIPSSEYDIAGYAEAKNSVGTHALKVVYRDLVQTFDVNIEPLKVDALKVTYPTAKSTFFTGTKFSDVGLVVSAQFNNGEKSILKSDQYVLKMDGQVLDDEFYFTKDMIGKKTVTVEYTDQDPNVDPNGKKDSFNINIKEAELESIYFMSDPAKTTYYLNEEFNPAGMVVGARYKTSDGYKHQALLENEYTITGFDSSVETDNLVLTVTLNSDPSKTLKLNLKVSKRKAVGVQFDSYPRTTFAVNEPFDAKGIALSTMYNSDEVESMNNDVIYYYDGSQYYTLTAPKQDEDDEVVIKPDAQGRYIVDEATAKAADYYVDVSEYDSSSVGVTSVAVVFENFVNETLTISIVEAPEYVWKPAVFGASSMGLNEEPPRSEIYVDDVLVDTDTFDSSIGFMKDGKFTNVNKIRLNSWGQAGKISGDQDGIAYYYTKIDAKSNFTLSADIKVNRYNRDPDDPESQADIEQTKAEYGKILGRDITTSEALDMVRSGQESFGLEARDAVPLFAKDGLGDDNLITIDTNKAQKDKYGEPINIYEAYLKGMKAVDYKGETRKVDIKNVSPVFASNIVLAGGYSGSTYSRDIKASNYYKNTQLNRINLFVRKGVYNYINGGGTRVGPYETTDTPPEKNEMYNITLQRINYGYKITTHNYQTGETRSNYAFDNTDDIQDVLIQQADKDHIWIGFYACRWADMDVTNVRLYESDAATDPVISNLVEETYSPRVSVESSIYTSDCDYTLLLKANNRSGGLVTIKQGDEEIYTDVPIAKSATSYPVVLEPDSKTEFTVTYKPSHLDLCVSYAPVVERFVVTNKVIDTKAKELYVSPTGSVKTGDGTRQKPIDLESAIGLCEPGQKIIMLDGTYHISDKITIPLANTGTAKARKYLVADEGATPVIDLQKLTGGFSIAGYYWVFEGITICNGAGNTKPFEIGGNHIIVDNCVFHDNGDTGLQISRVNNKTNIVDWPGYNLVKNCESYNNCDPSKNNADGFAAKLTSGYGNIFKNCIAHHNVDDGWDLYTKLATGPIGHVTLEDCVAYKHGYQLDASGNDASYSKPDGCNGFKTGGENIGVMHYIKDSITFENMGSGIDSNFNPWLKARNVVSYGNERYNVALYTNTPSNYAFDMKGIISYKGHNADRIGTLSYNENVTFENAASKEVDINGTTETREIAPLLSPDNYFIYGFGNTETDDETLLAAFENEETFNEYFGFKNYVDNGSKLTYKTLKELAKGGYDLNSYNSDLKMVDDSFFKSVDKNDSLEKGRYKRDENGMFIKGDFLALTTPFVHDSADAIDYSQVETTEATTEATTKAPVEDTTKKPSYSGGGSSRRPVQTGDASKKAEGIATVEKTTVTESKVEVTTAEAKSFTTPSGVVITPPVASGIRVNFSDINSRPWAVASINKLAQAGIVNGTSADTFSPDAYSKRADFIVMLVKTLGLTGSTTDNFDDVASGKYYANALAIAKSTGVATGYGDGNFGPEKNITRQDMMVLVAKAIEFVGGELDTDTAVLAQFADAAAIADYAKPYVAALVNLGLASGTDTGFQPTALITRAQTAVLVAKLYDTVVEMAEAADVAVEEVTEEVSEETTEATEEVTEEVTEA